MLIFYLLVKYVIFHSSNKRLFLELFHHITQFYFSLSAEALKYCNFDSYIPTEIPPSFLLQGSFTSTGLVVSSKLPRFSDMYTLTIASADPKSISANEPVHFTKSVTEWYVSLASSLHFCMLTQ